MPATLAADSTAETAEHPRRGRLYAAGDALFRPAVDRPLTVRAMVVAAAAVAVGTAAGLGRTRGPGAPNTIWAEDGSILLTDALNESTWTALTTSLNGYYITAPRLFAEAATWVPVKWAAVVLAVEAALAVALIALLVYVASGSHLRDPVLRVIVSAPVIVTPVGALFTPHHLVTLQFIALYAIFWLLLWDPVRRLGKVIAVGFILLAALSSVLTVGLLPLAVFRVVVRRTRYSIALLAALVLGLLVQFGALVFGAASRTGAGITNPRPDPFWAVAEYVLWAVPYSVLGQRWMEPGITDQNGFYPTHFYIRTMEHLALGAIAWCIVLVICAIALRRITKPAWALAVVAAAHSLLLFAIEVMGFGYESDSYLVPETTLIITDRYLVPVCLLLIVTFVALLRPDGTLGRDPASWPANAWPIMMFATLLAVTCVANYRHDNPRSHSVAWTGAVAKARAECVADPAKSTVEAHVGSRMWGNYWPMVVIPCERLR
jgi:hypothetical protein